METILKTQRLILRPFQESDYADLFEFLSQLEFDEFEGYPGITYENGREQLKNRIASKEFFAIERTDLKKVIGNIYCGDRNFESKEVGYIVNKLHQRQGYAAEALSAVIETAFKNGTYRIFAECDPRNVPSWRLLEKAGFRREAHFRQNIYFFKDENGAIKWKDTYVYAMLNSD